MDINAPLIALTSLLIGGIVLGIATLSGLRLGADYMLTRGNPRNRDQAHNTLVDLIKGLAIVGSTVAGAAIVATTLGVK